MKQTSHFFFFIILSIFTLQTLLIAESGFSKNTQVSISYGKKGLEKKFKQEHLTKMFHTILSKYGYYNKNGAYMLKITLEDLTGTSTKSSTEATSSISYKVINIKSNALISTTLIALPHREFNYAELPQKEILVFAREKSLQKNITKYLSMHLSLIEDIEEEIPQIIIKQKNHPENSRFIYFAGIDFGYNYITVKDSDGYYDETIPSFKAGVIINSSHRFSVNYEAFLVAWRAYTLNYDYIIFEKNSFKPYLGLNLGLAHADLIIENEYNFIYGAQLGLLYTLQKNIELEIGLHVNRFQANIVNTDIEYTKIKGFTGVNFKF